MSVSSVSALQCGWMDVGLRCGCLPSCDGPKMNLDTVCIVDLSLRVARVCCGSFCVDAYGWRGRVLAVEWLVVGFSGGRPMRQCGSLERGRDADERVAAEVELDPVIEIAGGERCMHGCVANWPDSDFGVAPLRCPFLSRETLSPPGRSPLSGCSLVQTVASGW